MRKISVMYIGLGQVILRGIRLVIETGDKMGGVDKELGV
jgi:hypothetical protein